MAPEPVITNSLTVKIYFAKDGDYDLNTTTITAIENWLRPLVENSLPTIQKFHKDTTYPLPKFITIGAGTTSKGSYRANQRVAQRRISEVTGIVTGLLEEMEINAEIIQKIITKNSDYEYNPTNLDANFSDRTKAKSKDIERFAYITVKQLTTKGLSQDQITGVEHGLEDAIDANGNPLFINFNPDETEIVKQICKLKTYSDITDLNLRVGNLQKWINDSITDEGLWNDRIERRKIMGCLNTAAKNSGKGKIVTIVGDKLVIILQ
jgi:hypothetical protein